MCNVEEKIQGFTILPLTFDAQCTKNASRSSKHLSHICQEKTRQLSLRKLKHEKINRPRSSTALASVSLLTMIAVHE